MRIRWKLSGMVPIALAVLLQPVLGDVHSRSVRYFHDETEMVGALAWDDRFEGQRPGVLVFHEWWGLNEYARERAEALARMGYVALAADLYGEGRTAQNSKEAGTLAGETKSDRQRMRCRARAALELLRAQATVDPARMGAIGYCFGGTAALELARSGADLQAVVSFHGGLDTPDPAGPGDIRASILICHGADDPHVSPEEVAAFREEVRRAGVDWQMNIYGGAVHSFTNPAAGDDPSSGAAYDPVAARRSWAAMKLFFAETIGLPADGEGGVGAFIRQKIARPLTKAGKTTGKAVGKAGKATGKAFKKAARWTEEKITDEDEDPEEPPEPTPE